ncbi:MAG: PSD1 and planctomycete cytochrome C domain-containing protein [Pirellulaceae bacterium]|nr:PSD1 and planctomycete cytochrome C domain-containing protein [Pirellulaceae bacterium]
MMSSQSMYFFRPALGAIFFAGLDFLAIAAEPAEVDYLRDIKPIFAAHCTACHGPKKQENGLRLDAAQGIFAGGDNGPAIMAGKSAKSLLIEAIRGTSEVVSQMPPKGNPLSTEQIALLARWIDAGPKAPNEALAQSAQSSHWSFQPVVRPPLPLVKDPAWPRGAIDAFILAALEKQKLVPSPEAERPTLIRRVSLDLVGLPPAPEEVAAFAGDQSPDAYERLIDRLLASPHYGERWGRHWLDMARYADSNGYTRDFGRQIWKYREWVIDAINRGQPFDQFTIDQIAGDMLPQPTQEQLVATGFHRNTLINEEGGTDQEQFRIEAVADRVNTTGSVWLGLTLGCARCHTHKYDPITQTEYYQFFALLNNCDEPQIEVPSKLQVARGDLERREQVRAEIKRLEAEQERLRPELEAKQQAWEAEVTPQERARLPGPVQVAYDMKFADRDAKQKKLIEDYYKGTEAARQAFPLLQQIFQLREQEPKIATTMILRERAKPRETFVHKRGDFLDPGAKVTGGVLAVMPSIDHADEGMVSRLDFARWLVAADNPLTPRVAMNRDWQKFFGRGLVETEDDFGTQGSKPSHPELLDWLAREFIHRGWDVKTMHRQIVCSNTYRQSSEVRSDLAAADPQNKLLGRQARLRLDAEIVRDVALAIGGLLTETIGGPSVFPPQPEGVFDFTQDPKPWKAATGGDRYRRGMYTHFWRSSPYPMLLTFDAPGGNVTCTRRLRSNTPLQSLTLANDQAFFECAQALAIRAIDHSADDANRAEYAFRLCLAREPTSAERELLSRLVADETKATSGEPAAAWTRICRVLLNLDETITRE